MRDFRLGLENSHPYAPVAYRTPQQLSNGCAIAASGWESRNEQLTPVEALRFGFSYTFWATTSR
jgi:hypothetical protein